MKYRPIFQLAKNILKSKTWTMGHRNVEWSTSFLSLPHFLHLISPIPDNFHLSSLGLANSAVLPIIWYGNIWMFLFVVWSNTVVPHGGCRIRTVMAMDRDIWARTRWCWDSYRGVFVVAFGLKPSHHFFSCSQHRLSGLGVVCWDFRYLQCQTWIISPQSGHYENFPSDFLWWILQSDLSLKAQTRTKKVRLNPIYNMRGRAGGVDVNTPFLRISGWIFFIRPLRAELTNHGGKNIPNTEIAYPI